MRGILRHPIQAAAILVVLVAGASSLIAQPSAVADSDSVSNWAAPPYWTPPAERTRSAGSKGLEAVAIANPALAFHAVTPCRIADTRGFGFTGPYGPPHLTAAAVRSFAVTSPGTSCGIPSGVAGVSFNFAVVNFSASGNLIVYPTGAAAPSVSSLNWTPVEGAISNAAVIGLGSDSISVVVNGPAGSTVDLVIDVNGYFAADPVVSSLNTLSGALTLAPSGDVTVTPGAGTITLGTNATSSNTPNTIVRRDGSGNFSGNSTGFTGGLAGDVTGTQGATVVGSVGGSTAANVHTAEQIANAATSAETANAIVRRDGSADVQVHRIAASGGYTQPGTGGQSLKIIRGLFFANPVNILSGTGYDVVRNAVGSYTFTWSSAFGDLPSLQVNLGGTLGAAYLVSVSTGTFTISTRDSTGTLFDPPSMSFVAIGTAP
jgi:hypothetical protein